MKHKLKIALASALAATSFNAFAEEAKSDYSISYNMGLYSQYIFRGYTQTHNDPALQGGIDLELSSGLYAGAWASNISWIRDRDDTAYDDGASIEMDIYGGFANEIADTGIRYDVGYLRYIYPGDRNGGVTANTTELHVGAGYGWVDAAVHVVTSDDAWTWGRASGTGDSAKGTTYYEINSEIPIGELIGGHSWLKDVTANLHYGYQHFAGAANNQDSYGDWKLGLDKGFGNGVSVGYFYTDTDVRNDNGWWTKTKGEYLGDENHTFYLTKTF